MKKSDFQMAINAVSELADRLSYSEDEDDQSSAEECENLAKRMRVEFWKKYQKK